MGDPRAADVAQAEQLLAQAADEGAAELPLLSAAELWVLCGDRQVLANEAELRWWAGMPEWERAKLADGMLEVLTDRGLLRQAEPAAPAGSPGPPRSPGSSARPMAPELAMIVAARQRPCVVAVGVGAHGATEGTPRMFGLAEHDRPPRVLVAERIARQPVSQPYGPVVGPLHYFSLLSVRRAARVLALWATAPGQGRRLPGRLSPKGQARSVDIYRPGFGEEFAADRLMVSAGHDGRHEVSRQRPGSAPEPTVACGTEELAGQLAEMLTGEYR